MPWTENFKHLGVHIENKINGCEYDLTVKRASFISRCIELNQEFRWAHPTSKIQINKIYNSHFYGSVLWNLFGTGAISLESSYNKAIKIMLGLPLATHRYLIEPLSGEMHLRRHLIVRFFEFVKQIQASKKPRVIMLLNEALSDVRSNVGGNMRSIQLMVGKFSLDSIDRSDVENILYHPINEEEEWRIGAIQELLKIKNGEMEVADFDVEEIDSYLHSLCTE